MGMIVAGRILNSVEGVTLMERPSVKEWHNMASCERGFVNISPTWSLEDTFEILIISSAACSETYPSLKAIWRVRLEARISVGRLICRRKRSRGKGCFLEITNE